jgi:hypothetical protein
MCNYTYYSFPQKYICLILLLLLYRRTINLLPVPLSNSFSKKTRSAGVAYRKNSVILKPSVAEGDMMTTTTYRISMVVLLLLSAILSSALVVLLQMLQ